MPRYVKDLLTFRIRRYIFSFFFSLRYDVVRAYDRNYAIHAKSLQNTHRGSCARKKLLRPFSSVLFSINDYCPHTVSIECVLVHRMFVTDLWCRFLCAMRKNLLLISTLATHFLLFFHWKKTKTSLYSAVCIISFPDCYNYKNDRKNTSCYC